MANYSTIEGLWLTRLQGMTAFNTSNSARGKWGILNSGRDDQYAVLKPGERERAASGLGGQMMDTHRTIIQVYQRYKDDGTSMTDLEALVESIVNELDTYPYLGDSGNTVVMGTIVQVREYQEILASDGGGPILLLAELVGEAHEETSPTLAE